MRPKDRKRVLIKPHPFIRKGLGRGGQAALRRSAALGARPLAAAAAARSSRWSCSGLFGRRPPPRMSPARAAGCCAPNKRFAAFQLRQL